MQDLNDGSGSKNGEKSVEAPSKAEESGVPVLTDE
jgi:hypothetical protein